MRNLLICSLLLAFIGPGQTPTTSPDSSAVTVLSFKWSKTRQAIEKLDAATATVGPAPAMIAANKNFARNVRANDPAGVRDPNADTLDGRSAAMEKNVQDARHPQLKPVDGFAYTVKVQNTSTKVAEVVFWEYQFIDPANPNVIARRQFLCGLNIQPGKKKDVQAFSLSGPSDVISVGSLDKAGSPFMEKALINRVEYADGTIWQRKDWNFGEIRLTYARAVATPWGSEMCRGL
jgi:hypothetical protein